MTKSLLTCLLTAFILSCSNLRAEVNIIPRPTQIIEGSGEFVLQDEQTISFNHPSISKAGGYLQRILTRATGFNIPVKKGTKGQIKLILSKSTPTEDASYRLKVTQNDVTIEAASYRGIINGIASLRQLLPDAIEKRSIVSGVRWNVPVVEIKDKPAYHWRGLMLDPSRHFYSVEETERFLDHMALYKFNKFHWHLTDGVGWRIEIKQYPELTRKGAWREFRADIDEACMNRAKNENNPTLLIPEKYCRTENGKTLYGGFYTQDDIREVLYFASVRGIDIIPEIDMPGHNWITTQCYPWLSCGNDGNDPLCLGKETTLEFCRNVYKEIFDLFPYEYVHIGGDEVDRNRWNNCADCQKRIKEKNLKDVTELQAWFTKYMEKYFNQHGRKLMGWDEILEGGVSKTATVYWWRGDHADVAQKSTNMGNEVVICPTTFCYFDYGQDNNTVERIYRGDIIPADLNAQQLKLVKGIQSNIWGEFIPTEARMQFMVFPRALAMIEKTWTPKEAQDWDNFRLRMQGQLSRLKAAGINYRPLETNQP